MAFINERDRQAIRKEFKALDRPVKLVLFTDEKDCQYCRDTKQLLEEVASLSNQLALETYNIITDKDKADEFGIARA